MKTHWQKLRDSLHATYWFVPLAMVLAAVVLWQITGQLDAHLEASGKLPLTWLYTDNIDSLRTLLLTIAGAMIGITGVVFSILMVPLTIAASQFGPRLLRNFLRDTGTHLTLGTFTATTAFSLLVLLHLRAGSTLRLPQISVNTALLLGLASFCMLIYFIHHVSVSIQAPVLAAEVSKKLQAAIEREFPDSLDTSTNPNEEVKENVTLKAANHVVLAATSGYVQVRDNAALLQLAIKQNAVIQLLLEPGGFMAKGTPLANIWYDASPAPDCDNVINKAFITGTQRTLVQDVTFGINELVEMAIRALSPAINDPFTAMTCLDWLGTALCRLCTKTFEKSEKTDNENRTRLLSSPVTFTLLTNAAFNQIREYGRASTAVTLRLMDTIAVVAQCAATEEQRHVLLFQAGLVKESSHIGLLQEADQQLVTDAYQKVIHILNWNKK